MRWPTLLLLFAVSSCRKPAQTEEEAPAPPPAPHPIDHLAPDELLEGTEKAFALVLPRVAQTQGAFSDVVYVQVEASANALGKYLREHVRDGTTTVRDGTTIFERVRVPSDPQRWLTLRVRPQGILRANLEVRDVTPPPPIVLPDEAARWRAAGLKPNGQVLDPTHLH
jgi:hypothetical protein